MKVLVLRAPGINCDGEAAAAMELAGATAERIHVNRLTDGSIHLLDYGMLLLPGGFAYGDHLGAGRMLAVDLIHRLQDDLQTFINDGRPVLGICNGFQVLVKAGLLPGDDQQATLAQNSGSYYECRWTTMRVNPHSPCLFTAGLDETLELPVGHGEGRFVAAEHTLTSLRDQQQIVLQYSTADGTIAADYPANPNGSAWAIAGICNAQGNVFGLMPHPDRAFLPQQHPQWRRRGLASQGAGMQIFRNAVRAMQHV